MVSILLIKDSVSKIVFFSMRYIAEMFLLSRFFSYKVLFTRTRSSLPNARLSCSRHAVTFMFLFYSNSLVW